MALVNELTETGPITRLDGELTVFTALELKKELLGLFEQDRIALDLSSVIEMDACGAQLLSIWRHEAQKAGKAVQIVATNPLVDQVLAQLGLESQLASLSSTEKSHHGS